MESFDQGSEGIIDADDAKQDAEEDDETIVGDSSPIESGAFEFEVKVTGPDEGEHGASEAADKSHQDGEMRDGNSHDGGEDD